jgi:hypothetical protein
MKKLLIAITIIGASLIGNSAYSQVYVNAHVGFGVPFHRAYYAPAPRVVYQEAYAPAPAPVVCENVYPEAAYYTYPAWHGHYHDSFYYAHWRPYYEREHRGYDRHYYGHRW